jgi:predicted methyltransferase
MTAISMTTITTTKNVALLAGIRPFSLCMLKIPVAIMTGAIKKIVSFDTSALSWCLKSAK